MPRGLQRVLQSAARFGGRLFCALLPSRAPPSESPPPQPVSASAPAPRAKQAIVWRGDLQRGGRRRSGGGFVRRRVAFECWPRCFAITPPSLHMRSAREPPAAKRKRRKRKLALSVNAKCLQVGLTRRLFRTADVGAAYAGRLRRCARQRCYASPALVTRRVVPAQVQALKACYASRVAAGKVRIPSCSMHQGRAEGLRESTSCGACCAQVLMRYGTLHRCQRSTAHMADVLPCAQEDRGMICRFSDDARARCE